MTNFVNTVASDITLGDYRLSALTFKEIGEYIRWYQYKDYTDAIAIGVNDKELLKTIYDSCRANKYSFDSPDLIKSMITPEGVRKLTYLMIRKNHPDFKENQVDEVVNVMNYDQIALDIMGQVGLIVDDENKEDSSGE